MPIYRPMSAEAAVRIRSLGSPCCRVCFLEGPRLSSQSRDGPRAWAWRGAVAPLGEGSGQLVTAGVRVSSVGCLFCACRAPALTTRLSPHHTQAHARVPHTPQVKFEFQVNKWPASGSPSCPARACTWPPEGSWSRAGRPELLLALAGRLVVLLVAGGSGAGWPPDVEQGGRGGLARGQSTRCPGSGGVDAPAAEARSCDWPP